MIKKKKNLAFLLYIYIYYFFFRFPSQTPAYYFYIGVFIVYVPHIQICIGHAVYSWWPMFHTKHCDQHTDETRMRYYYNVVVVVEF